MTTLKSFGHILDRHTLAVSVLAVLSTWLCLRFGVVADLPSVLIGTAVIFPIVFSINAAYKRREDALGHLASAKGHAVAIAWAHRDWSGGDAALAGQGRERIAALFDAVRDYFLAPEESRGKEALARVYGRLSELSRSHEALRAAGVPANEVSRANQYLRAIVIDFERMRNILEYRTPVALRAYSRVFLNAFPILFGPNFARIALDSSPTVGYLVAVVFSLVLVSLDNIQDALENPYDTVGEDDIDLDVTGELVELLDAG
jgi:hypothetical protein